MHITALVEHIRTKKSLLCVGLDTDIKKLPPHLLSDPDPIFSFNQLVIDATHDLCVAYKPNIAFYESMGRRGWESLEKTMDYIRSLPQPVFTIADAKRGDIGNTSHMYAQAFFDHLGFDAVTVTPYMGEDSLKPFLDYKDKTTIVLALTSNPGSADFQLREDKGEKLYEQVLRKVSSWGSPDNTMFVVGATHPEQFASIRQIVPEHFFLVPGVGSQGGDLQAVCQHGLNQRFGLLINSSRQIIYAANDLQFDVQVRAMAMQTVLHMRSVIPFN
jgi:orotidine-5'-phosphate decarboxylase